MAARITPASVPRTKPSRREFSVLFFLPFSSVGEGQARKGKEERDS